MRYNGAMQMMRRSLFRAGTRRPFYFGFLGFLGGFISMAGTVNSNALVERLGEGYITPVYIAGAALAAAFFLAAPSFLSALGNRPLFLGAAVAETMALLALATGGHLATLLALIFTSTSFGLIWLSLDIFFEHSMCSEEETGTARGIYLTFQNIAYAGAPLVAGALAGWGGFTPVYIVDALIVSTLILSVTPAFRTFSDPVYPDTSIRLMAKALANNHAARRATFSNLILRFYFSIAFVYIPLLLRLHYHFSWPEIGLMLGISTLPYALFELPLGRIADRARDERRILIAGFVLLAASTALLGLPLPHDLGLITVILFLQGIGASMVEIMTETHFFRAVGAQHSNVIALFRITQPVGVILSTATGGILLAFMPLSPAFFVFGSLILLGILPAYAMHRSGPLPNPEKPAPVLEKPAGTLTTNA